VTTTANPQDYLLESDRRAAEGQSADPSWRDLRSQAWRCNTDQERTAFYHWLRQGLDWQAALFAAQHSDYAQHLRADYAKPLGPGEFAVVIEEARRRHTDVEDLLRQRGFRGSASVPKGLTPKQERDRILHNYARLHDSYIKEAEAAVPEDDPEPPRAPSAASRASRAAWQIANGLVGAGRKDRPSQTREGRRLRHLRQIAERDGMTIEQADRLHPRRIRP
jgi:hypothetical protein